MKFQFGIEMFDSLSNEQIECINSWPNGTLGNSTERLVIQELNDLCKRFGYGRVPQIANALEEIWRNPEEGGKKWQDIQNQRMKLLEEDRKWLEENKEEEE